MKTKYIIGFLSFFSFLVVLFLVLFHQITSFDDYIYSFIYSIHNSFFDSFFPFITMLGNTIPVLCIVIPVNFLLVRYVFKK